MSSQGTTPTTSTFTGDRALEHDEPLLFERGNTDKSGVDLPEPRVFKPRLANLERREPIGLPGLSEPETLRHYVRLSRQNFAIDSGPYPLGSCTMKHNPRLNERMARLPGFADIHPLQPVKTVQGAIALMQMLSGYLLELTGMKAVALSPRAGAHGELCGMLAIKAAHAAKGPAGERRKIVLVPDSAHGTNPATAALLGYTVKPLATKPGGWLAARTVKAALEPGVAALMLTNPNTCGLFEPEVEEIAQIVHGAEAYFYCDGANLNAILGKVRAGDLGVDAMHINLHKTFSTPHGGGGPGAGPVVFSEALAPFAPLPYTVRKGDTFQLVEDDSQAHDRRPFGRLTVFHGQMGMFVRALTFMLSHGGDGLRQVAEDAVLNANYVRVGLKDLFSQPFGDKPCMHEVLFDDAFLKGTGVSTLDFAKAMIDEGYHPMTVYFPLIAHGAMLIEPTESESKHTLDRFIAACRALALAAKSGDVARFRDAPRFAPRRRLDETKAARELRLRWKPQPAPAK
jgi:glycine dehydrogenase subunit 2